MHRSAPRAGVLQTLSLIFKRLKAGILGVLAVSRTESRSSWSSWLPWLDLLLRTWQLLSFVTDSTLGAPWPAAVSPVEVGGSFTNVRAYASLFPTSVFASAAFFASIAWVFILTALLSWGIYYFARDSIPYLLPLKVLRIMANLSVGILFIPLLQLLLSPPTACSSSCDADGTSSDAARKAIGLVLALLLIFLAFLFAAVFYNSESLSRNSDACAHGRVNVLMLLIKLIATIIGGRVIPGLSVTFVGSVLLVCGLAWLASYLYFLPHYRHLMNAANVGAALVFLWSLECLLLNNAYRSTDASITLWIGMPFVFLTGAFLATGRASAVIARPSAQLSSPFAVEQQNRYLLHQALWGHYFVRMPDSPGAGGLGNASLAALLAQDASIGASDVFSRATALRAAVPKEIIDRVLASYRSAATRFPDSAIIHVFLARFYAEWLGNKHMMLSHLAQAERRSPGIDLAFIIFAARRSDESEGSGSRGSGAGGHSSSSLTAINRVAFEKHTADARFHVQLASSRNLLFWSELVESQPDLSKLHRFSAEMNTSCLAAETAFKGALELVAHSVFILRLYAAFNLHVLVNVEKAEVLLAEADRIEEASSKEHRTDGVTLFLFGEESNADLWTESTGYLSISAGARDVGTIISANAAACKLFGLSRLQLERRSVFSLLPPLFDTFYEASLHSHAVSGEGEIVNFSRLTFAQQRGGVIVPVISSFKDAPADDGPPSYLFIVRELQSDLHFILLDGTDALVSATAGTLALLDITPHTLHSREASMADYCDEWTREGVREELLSPKGRVLRIDVKLPAPAVSEEEDGVGSVSSSSAAGASDDEGEPERMMRTASSRQLLSPAAAVTTAAPVNIRSTWIRAHLQPVRLLGDGKAFVLHWARLPAADATLIHRAESKRTELLRTVADRQAPAPAFALKSFATSSRNIFMRSVGDGGVLSTATSAPAATATVTAPPFALVAHDEVHDEAVVSASLFGGAAEHKGSNKTASAAPPMLKLPSSDTVYSAVSSSKSPNRRSTHSMSDSVRKPASSSVGSKMTRKDTLEDSRSQSDRSSATSAYTKVGRTMARLRRILSTEASVLMPGLWWLRTAGRALVVLAIILTVALVIVTRVSFLSVYNNVLYVQTASDALYYKGAAIIAAQNLMLSGRGWLPLSDAGIASTRAKLTANVQSFLDAESSLFSLAQSSGNAGAFTARYLSLTSFALKAESVSGNVQVLNAREVVAEFASVMNGIANLSMAEFGEFSDGESHAHPLLASMNINFMRGGNGHDGLLFMSNLGFISTLQTQKTIQTTQDTVFGTMTALLILLGAFLFLPILAHVDRTSDEIMSQFVSLALPVRKGLYAQAQRRMLMLKRFTRTDEEAEDGPEDDDDELDGGGGGGEVVAVPVAGGDTSGAGGDTGAAEAGKAKNKEGLPTVDENGHVNWDELLGSPLVVEKEGALSPGGRGANSSSRRRAQRKATPVFRKSRASFAFLAFKFLVPLIVLEVLFIVVYSTFIVTTNNALALTAVSAAANTRASCGRQALADLIKLLYLEVDSKYVQEVYVDTHLSVLCVLDHTALLAYGTTPATLIEPYSVYTPMVENGAPSVLSPSDSSRVYGAMFGNACPLLASVSTSSSFDIAACEAFSSGTVRLGLASLANTWAVKISLLSDMKLRSSITSQGLLNGTGFLVPTQLFNYSSVSCASVLGARRGCFPLPDIPGPDSGITPPMPEHEYYAGVTLVPEGAVPWGIADAFSSPEYAWLTEDLLYLTPGLRAVAAIYNTAALNAALSFITFLTTFASCWITFFAGVVFFFFVPSVHSKNASFHTTRSMLLYLPVPVVMRAKAILSLIEDILTRNSDAVMTQGGGGGGAGGARASIAPAP